MTRRTETSEETGNPPASPDALNWKHQGRILRRFVFALALIASLPAAASAAEAGSIDANPSLFTVMAAINAAGYKADSRRPTITPSATPFRRNWPSAISRRWPLKEFFDKHRKRTDSQELSQYISFALSCTGPPNFEFAHARRGYPARRRRPARTLRPCWPPFTKRPISTELWQRSQPAIDQYIARYHEPVTNAVLQVNGYLRQMTSGFKSRRSRSIVELQAAPNQIQTRSYSDNYTIVVTPSPEPRTFDIRHGYLHYLLDPLATRNQEILNRKKSLVDHAMRAQALSDAYKEDYLLLVTESLIKAIESRLDHKPAMMQEALKEGYILAPYFAEALPVYEKQESTMLLYYKEMMQAIDLVKEDKRLTRRGVPQVARGAARGRRRRAAAARAYGRGEDAAKRPSRHTRRANWKKPRSCFCRCWNRPKEAAACLGILRAWRESHCSKRIWTRRSGYSRSRSNRSPSLSIRHGITCISAGCRSRPANATEQPKFSRRHCNWKARPKRRARKRSRACS